MIPEAVVRELDFFHDFLEECHVVVAGGGGGFIVADDVCVTVAKSAHHRC